MNWSTNEVLSTGRIVDVQRYNVLLSEGTSKLICASPWKVLALNCSALLVRSSSLLTMLKSAVMSVSTSVRSTVTVHTKVTAVPA